MDFIATETAPTDPYQACYILCVAGCLFGSMILISTNLSIDLSNFIEY